MNKLFFLISILLFSGFSPLNNQNSNNKITTFCDGLMPVEQCAHELEEPYSSLILKQRLLDTVFLNNDNKQLIFFTYKNCCSDLEISSIKQKDLKTTIHLKESGTRCKCGHALQKVEINTNKPIKKNNLEIYHKDHSKDDEMIYPPKNQ